MRDTDKYYYTEVALPRSNPATARLLERAERTGQRPRALIVAAALDAYSDDNEEQIVARPAKPKRTRSTNRVKGETVTGTSVSSANAFLDEIG
jgi:hypothetical protein